MAARLTVQQIEEALKAKAGNIAAAARDLGVARTTIYRQIERSVGLQELLTDTREELVDIAESALRREVLNGNITAIIFTLKTQGKARGYVERVQNELTGADGGAIKVTDGLTDDERSARIAALFDAARARRTG